MSPDVLTDDSPRSLAIAEAIDAYVGVIAAHGIEYHMGPIRKQALEACAGTAYDRATEEQAAELAATRNNRLISAVFGHHKGAPKPFALYRREDQTGVSGTGVVAVGVEFPDGMVVLRWTSAFPTSVVFHERGIESVEAVHGHGGKTQIVWLSDELESLAEMERQRDEARAELARYAERLDQLRAVVDAAQAWRRWFPHASSMFVPENALIAAVDAYRLSECVDETADGIEEDLRTERKLPVCADCGHRHRWGGECADHRWGDACPYDAGADCEAAPGRVVGSDDSRETGHG